MSQPTGYADPTYAEVECGQGTSLRLPASGGALLVRKVPGTGLRDARAPYPFLVCADWRKLAEDMSGLPDDVTSVTAVIDPLADVDSSLLERAFNHVVRPYKTHFVIDLTRPLSSFANPHHLGCARRALRKVEVEQCPDPAVHFAEWLRLYGMLVARHNIRGAALMTEDSFRRLFRVRGLTLFRAVRDRATIGMILCLAHGDHAYFHLGAYDEVGYRSKASYALVRTAVDHFASAGLALMSIGAGAGAFGDGDDGLTAFKQGWASTTRTALLCGHIHSRDDYSRLVALAGTAGSPYFPAYRAGEYA